MSRAKNYGWLVAIGAIAIAGVLAVSSFTFTRETKPTIAETLAKELVEIPSLETEEWLSTPLKGEFKGNTADLASTFTLTVKDLKEYNLTWKDLRFFVKVCRFYSTTGNPENNRVPELASYCTNRTVTRAEAITHHEQEQAKANAQGSPALIG